MSAMKKKKPLQPIGLRSPVQTRPGPCPHCDEDHIKASCLAPFGVYGGCKSARIAFDAGAASRQAEINRLEDELRYARSFDPRSNP